MNDLFELMQGYNRVMEAGMKCGRDMATLEFNRKLRTLETAYQQALLDPQTKIPSYLGAVIVSLTLDMANDYADAMIHRDLRERHEGRADQDMDTFGRPLRPGS